MSSNDCYRVLVHIQEEITHRPLSGILLRAFNVFSSEPGNFLGEAQTNQNGEGEIRFTYSEGFFGKIIGEEKNRLDLVVRAYNNEGNELASSPRIHNASREENLTLEVSLTTSAGNSQHTFPSKLRLYVFDEETGKPLRGVPVQLILTLRIQGKLVEKPQGILSSNQVGYMAFDLSSLKGIETNDLVASVFVEVPMAEPIRLEITEKFLSLPTRATGDLLNSEQVLPLALPGRLDSSLFTRQSLASIQSPDIADWLLSPGSFGADAFPVIGEDGCQTLLPSHAAERIIRFHQLVRDSSTEELQIPFDPTLSYDDHPEFPPTPESGWPRQLNGRIGELRHYELVWLPLTHALGKVLYSLTLAPCEAVRIAVIDWTRSDEVERTENTRFSDNLQHSQRRDRTVEEIVNAVLTERQSGESFLGGMAGVGGYGGGFGGGGMPAGGGNGATPADGNSPTTESSSGGKQQAGQNWGITGSHALGYSLANSSGNREVEVESTQALVDEIVQTSHLVRDLRSTVIVQATQAERETVQTRIVRNHNHSHALTILYYEVVRHYLIRALRKRTDKVIFIKYPVREFLFLDLETKKFIRKHESILHQSLLDNRLHKGFDALSKIPDPENTSPPSLEIRQPRVLGLVVNIKTANKNTRNDRLKLVIVNSGGKPIIKQLGLHFGVVPHYFNRPIVTTEPFINELYNSNASNTFFIDLKRFKYEIDNRTTGSELPGFGNDDSGSHIEPGKDTITPLEIKQIGIIFNQDVDNADWDFEGITVYASVLYPGSKRQLPEYIKILDTREAGIEPFSIKAHGDWMWDVNVSFSQKHKEFQEQVAAAEALVTHLNENRLYYNMSIWLNENPQERAVRFEKYLYQGKPLIDQIENRPIDVVGSYLVFRVATDAENVTPDAEILAQRIISLPTRGAFAEAKLSHCNASEVIDDTRFWDWQISPCPDNPAEIAPITIGSRHSPLAVSPSTFPSSGVGISTPPEAPEPYGLREVVELLRTPEIFRDMSGIEQLGPLLQKLVEVAGEVEKARIGATTQLAQAQSSVPAGETPPTSNTPTSRSSSTAASDVGRSSPQTVARDMANAMRAIDRVEDPRRRTELTESLAERAVTTTGSPAPQQMESRDQNRDSSPPRPSIFQIQITDISFPFGFGGEREVTVNGRLRALFGYTSDDEPIAGSWYSFVYHGRGNVYGTEMGTSSSDLIRFSLPIAIEFPTAFQDARTRVTALGVSAGVGLVVEVLGASFRVPLTVDGPALFGFDTAGMLTNLTRIE